MSTELPESISFKRKERCGFEGCRSRRFFREKDSQEVICEQGHPQPDIPIDPTGGDFGNLQSNRRSRIKRAPIEKVSQIRRGSPGLLLFLQSYQIILQRQSQALVQASGFLAEFERVVKDLWALRLQHFSERFDDLDNQTDIVFSSQASQESNLSEVDRSPAKWKTKALPTLMETLALNYLAAIMLRIPLTIGELHRGAVTEVVPFVRAINLVPLALKKHMPAEYYTALDTITPLGPDHLRRSVHRLTLLYRHHFSIDIPPLNVPPILYRYVKDLALPMETFRTVVSLAQVLDIDFTFPPVSVRQYVSVLPETTLVSLIAVATKLYHPFESGLTSTSIAEDAGKLAIDWDAWETALREHRARLDVGDHLTPGTEIHVTSEEAQHMSKNQMDDYLDWFERTWVDEARAESAPRGVPKQLLDMFPVSGGSKRATPHDAQADAAREHESKMIRVQQTMSQLQERPILRIDADSEAENASPPVGARYKRYRRSDQLPPRARDFHNALAQAAAMGLNPLLTAVLQIESRILAWRRRQLGDGSSSSSSSSSDSNSGSDGSQADDVGPKGAGTSSELDEGGDDDSDSEGGHG